ncbi:MAG: chemotaxis protein CheW [bacterium]|nr:chemotaxis protein CheW [bacterium]
MARQYCTFYLDDLFMGIEAEKVQEVLRLADVTPVPLASASIHGLINLRGRIVTAVNLRRQLGMSVDMPTEQPMNIILGHQEGTLSFVVDKVGDVVEVNDEDFETPPDTLKGTSRRMIRGAYKLESQLLLILDTVNALECRVEEDLMFSKGVER